MRFATAVAPGVGITTARGNEMRWMGDGTRLRRVGTRWIGIWAVLAAMPAFAQRDSATDGPSDPIDHDARPLTADDFRAAVPSERPKGEPPDELPIEAYSRTDVRYRFEAPVTKVRNRFRAELTSIEFTATFDRAKSWNARPSDAALLDHHQGHFDLARIAAYQAEEALLKTMRRERVRAEGATVQEAHAAIELRIVDALRAIEREFQQEHRYFDQRTRYGTLTELEREERAKQRARLKGHAESRAAAPDRLK